MTSPVHVAKYCEFHNSRVSAVEFYNGGVPGILFYGSSTPVETSHPDTYQVANGCSRTVIVGNTGNPSNVKDKQDYSCNSFHVKMNLSNVSQNDGDQCDNARPRSKRDPILVAPAGIDTNTRSASVWTTLTIMKLSTGD